MSDTVTINDRGEAAFPKLGVIQVSGMSISALQDTLRARYAAYLRMPELETIVLRRVVVAGEVKQPNVFEVDVASTVADLIARAGGFTENSRRDRISLVRGGRSTPVHAWDAGGAGGLELQSGDEIVVGRRSWWAINALSVLSTAAILGSVAVALAK